MSEVRSNVEIDGVARLAASAHARLTLGLADLRIPDAYRLSEWQRTTIGFLLERLVGAVESELRGALAPAFPAQSPVHASLASAHVPIAGPILRDTMPWEPALIGALLRRAEEHRLQRAAADHALLIELAGDRDEAVADQAMALLIAQSSRLDAFQEPVMPRGELPAELAHALVWTVAAALRRYLVAVQSVAPAAADVAIADAVALLLRDHDEGESFPARCLRLMRRLDGLGRLDDEMAARSLAEGGLPLFLAFLAVRTPIDMDSAWELVADRGARGAALILRAASLGKEAAGAILFQLHGDAAVAELDRFETLAPDAALEMLALWQADPAYRAAVARMTS